MPKNEIPQDPQAAEFEKKDSEVKETVAVPRTKILIPSHTGPAGSDDVFVSVNGRDFLIKRDVEVEVPDEVLGALKNAVVTDYVTDENGRITRERQVPRFPFQVV